MTQAKRLRTLEEENAELKKLLAEAMLDIAVLKGISKKMVTPGAKRSAVAHSQACHGLSERRACDLIGIARRVARYQPSRADDADLRQRLREVVAERRRFGCRCCCTRKIGQVRLSGWHG